MIFSFHILCFECVPLHLLHHWFHFLSFVSQPALPPYFSTLWQASCLFVSKEGRINGDWTYFDRNVKPFGILMVIKGCSGFFRLWSAMTWTVENLKCLPVCGLYLCVCEQDKVSWMEIVTPLCITANCWSASFTQEHWAVTNSDGGSQFCQLENTVISH